MDDSNFDLKLNEILFFYNIFVDVRILFFDKLICIFDGYELLDVIDVYVYYFKFEIIEVEDGNIEIGVYVFRVLFRGEGVFKFDELSDFYDRGFYIWKIKWKVKENLVDLDIFEFEV